jgi:DNA-binding CsgD family transcriptional regulator
MMAGQRPTRRQLEVLRAYIRAGSVAAAAYELGIRETTVRQHLSGLYRRTGCVNAAQAAYWLGTSGPAIDALSRSLDGSAAGSVCRDKPASQSLATACDFDRIRRPRGAG